MCDFFAGALSPCGSYPVSMPGGLILCSPMVASTLPMTTTLSSTHNSLQVPTDQVKGQVEEQATDLSVKPGDMSEVLPQNVETIKTEVKREVETEKLKNEKPPEKEKYVRFKDMDFGSYNEGTLKEKFNDFVLFYSH